MNLREFVHPAQLQQVYTPRSRRDSDESCTELNNLIAEKSFLFPVDVEARLLAFKTEMWAIFDEGNMLFSDAEKRGVDVRNNEHFRQLWKRYDAVLGPLENLLVTEVRSLLDADVRVKKRK